MKKLLDYLLKNLIGKDNYKIEVEESQEGHVNFNVQVDKDNIGLIIGKEGKTIKAIRSLLKVKAILEKKAVTINVSEMA